MNIINKTGSTFEISNFPWKDEYPATPKTFATLSYDDEGINAHFVSYETNLRATETQHNTFVHKDSCMEMFMQYAADTDPRYINIEMNPNGAAYSAVSFERGRSQLIAPEDIDTLNIKTEIFDDRWEIKLSIKAEYIKKYIPSYVHGSGAHLKGNLYKCGDDTDHPHFGCFNNIEVPQPDFHRPEFFADFVLE